MKKQIITLCSLFISTGLLANNVPPLKASELSWVDEQIEAIKPARVGAKNSYLNSVRNPFIFLKKTEKKKGVKTSTYRSSRTARTSTATKTSSSIAKQKIGKFALEAIINKSALIGGKWYKEGQYVHGYKLDKVSAEMVLLKKNTKTMVLTTKSKHRSLKFNNN